MVKAVEEKMQRNCALGTEMRLQGNGGLAIHLGGSYDKQETAAHT